jgi:hypothetical protein
MSQEIQDQVQPNLPSVLADEDINSPGVDKATAAALEILTKAKGVEVIDDASYDEACDLLNRARNSKKYLVSQRQDHLKLLKEHIRGVEAKFRTRIAPCEEADSILSKKTGDYCREKERKRQEEATRLAAEAEKARREQEAKLEAARRLEKMRADAEARPVEEVKLPETAPVPETIPEIKKTTITASGSKTTMRTKQHGVVYDSQAVPREYCSPDQKKIDAAIAQEITEIPGVNIVTDYIPVTG